MNPKGVVVRWVVAGAVFLSILSATPALAQEGSPVNSLAWSPDGSMLAVAAGNTVQILGIDGARTTTIRALSSEHGIISVSWSPEGDVLAMASVSEVEVRDVTAMELLHAIRGQNLVSFVAWSPDGGRLAIVDFAEILVWDTTTEELLYTLSGHIAPITEVSWSPDGTMLATVGRDSALLIWDADTGQILNGFVVSVDNGPPPYDRTSINSVAWSPDGNWIAIGNEDGTVRISDTEVLQSSGIFHSMIISQHLDSVVSLAWSPDSRWLASAGLDGTIRILDVVTGEQSELLHHETAILSIAWSPNGDRLAYGGNDGTIQIVNVLLPMPLAMPPMTPTSTSVSTPSCFSTVNPVHEGLRK